MRQFEREARRVELKGLDRGAPRLTDAAESENIDAGVEVFFDLF